MSQLPESVDPTRFRKAMGCLAAGVSIVTSADADGTPFGLTATAVCSVSLDPPIVLACLAASSTTHGAIMIGKRFALNFLGQRDAELARRFSSTATDKFVGVSWRAGPSGCPVFPGALAVCECVVEQAVSAGDHTVFFGRVVNVEIADGAECDPLIHFLSSYRSLTESEEP